MNEAIADRILTVPKLLQRISDGWKFQYHYFWGGPFSNWASAKFRLDGVEYPTSEHYMMVKKAELFGDQAAQEKILWSEDPRQAKAAGRTVKGFQESVWDQHKLGIVYDACLAKFQQNPDFGEFMLSTSDQILVEASPYDRIWGIGLDESEAENANDPFQWNGQNLLGFVLMLVRDDLRKASAMSDFKGAD